MGLRRVAPSTRGAIVGAVDAEVVAILALLLRVFGAGSASDAAAVTEVAGLRDALQLLGFGGGMLSGVHRGVGGGGRWRGMGLVGGGGEGSDGEGSDGERCPI